MVGDLGPFVAHARRQHAAGDLLHRLQGLAARTAGRGRALNLGRRIELVAGRAIGVRVALQRHERGERHHRARRAARLQLAQVRAVEPVGPVGLCPHLEGVAEIVEVVDVGGGEIGLERREHLVVGHAQDLRLLAIDIGVETRRLGVEAGENLGEGRIVRRRGDHLLHRLVERRIAQATGLVLDDHLEAAGGADAAHRRLLQDLDVGVEDVAGALLQVVDDPL